MTPIEPLIQDSFVGEPATKRTLAYIQSRREAGDHVVGAYCGYAPMELFSAMGLVPAVLCAFSNDTISAGERVLPANLCPLIKSSYGFIEKDTCPFYSISEAVIAETTCDGKKKMFEFIKNKPLHVMDLPQVPDAVEAKANWAAMIRKLQGFLEKTFDCKTTDEKIEAAIRDGNKKNRLLRQIFSYSSLDRPVIGWNELYDFSFLAQASTGSYMEPIVAKAVEILDERIKSGYSRGKENAPRVLVTGCPIGGDATKVFRVIEEAGGVIVGLDACTGIKCFMYDAKENTGDPVRALAEKYLSIPCSCMTPNRRRVDTLGETIDTCEADVVIDVILHACHSYNVESYKIGTYVKEKKNLPFLKIETDYSTSDVEQIRTRVEAVFDSVR